MVLALLFSINISEYIRKCFDNNGDWFNNFFTLKFIYIGIYIDACNLSKEWLYLILLDKKTI